ncbi:DUF4097 family beta strand repeat-containing protein [Maribacter cobaltidurans]|uniref:Uncharacterized protein n=1 Tax=Maribacter cobaltidurans TaxID=1178778 RepID=A0A223V3K2_9FLAO|nr:hypothetical protein [Maribacter cobaltidurans]ASV29985.1 hypothetical protein CJ263_06980 [Maribacter cobaltidurans]GGD88152.1 hypothetical protein GCM10011412_27480 [Maribacter cobaltidurans]
MKQIKTLKLTLLLGLISLTLNAQKIIEESFDYNGQFIDLDVKFASEIEVKTWDKNSVYFKANIHTKDAKFLDEYKLDINKTSNEIKITSMAEGVFKKFQGEWNENNKDKKRRYYNTGDWYDFNYVIYVPKKAKFKVSSINGDLKSEIIEGDFTADLINGNIDIAQYSGNLDLTTINGEIDLKMVNAILVAETIHGDIYADEKLKFSSEDRHVGQKIAGQIAEGKNRLRLNTINGNMYLRL